MLGLEVICEVVSQPILQTEVHTGQATTRSPIKVSGAGRKESRLPDALPISFLAGYALRSDPCCMFLICTPPGDGSIL